MENLSLPDVRHLVAAARLTSPLLVMAWPTLDRFEGSEYLGPIIQPRAQFRAGGERQLYTVANLYAATEAGPGAAML